MPIRPLPPLVVNQIAAGEVIERPASVVKELVENAIDAGAARIRVEIEEGGKALVRVTDDGVGIPPDELPLALAAHATSKIEAVEDLDHIATMGFRGEALASIASISRMELRSRTEDDDGAWSIKAEGGSVAEVRPAAGPRGTMVSIHNLFYNTPARRKFLRSETAETGRVVDMVQTIALAHPSIGFAMVTNGRVRFDLAPVGRDGSARSRVVAVLGADTDDDLLEVDVAEAGLRIWGLAGMPELARPTSRGLRVFLNGRNIIDRTITHAIRDAYRGLIEPSATPLVVLFIEMDPATVDVNVHPAKAEVRFRDQSRVHGVVRRAVQGRLREADLTPALELSGGGGRFAFGAGGGNGGTGGGTGAGTGTATTGEIVETLRRLAPREKGFVYSELKEALAAEAPEMLAALTGEREGDPPGAGAGGSAGGLPEVRAVTDALQVHRSYIVTQDDEGLVIIDQHALHERVMFERLRERVESGALESQRLLVPELVAVDREQAERLETLKPLLERIGIDAGLMGPEHVAVHAFTSLLFDRGVDPVDFMQDLLARAGGDGAEGGASAEEALHEVLDMMACKAAIKAGQPLAPKEMEELLAARTTVERSSNCPHGRPTTLRLSIRDLERQFGRR